MTKIGSILSPVELYIRMKPTFRGARAPVLCRVPFTATHPSPDQKAQRDKLTAEAYALYGTYYKAGTTEYKGKQVPKFAAAIATKLTKPEGAKVSEKNREAKRAARHALTAAKLGK